jgi:hypothetical protein
MPCKNSQVWSTMIVVVFRTDWLTIIHIPKKASYLNTNERKVYQRIKSDICANRFYEHIEDQKAAISEYLDKQFGRWI